LAIASDPEGYLPRLQRALDYYLVQDMEGAVGDLDAAVEAAPDLWMAYFVRSFVRFKMLEAEKINAGESALFPGKGNDLPNLDYRLVKSDLDKVVEFLPDFQYAYFNRGNVSVKLSDFKSAVVDYGRAIEIDDRFAEAYFNRGLARVYTGDYENAMADLSKAGELGLYQAYSIIKRLKYSAGE
jgi:tetratricopeptide (TPR) repeat protein